MYFPAWSTALKLTNNIYCGYLLCMLSYVKLKNANGPANTEWTFWLMQQMSAEFGQKKYNAL